MIKTFNVSEELWVYIQEEKLKHQESSVDKTLKRLLNFK